MNYFVTAIGTDSGKTVISAILCEALGRDYWKPIQAGLVEADRDSIRKLLPDTKIHDEAYRLTEPMSPHAAARIDGIKIDLDSIQVPQNDNLIIEGAGGIMVPINDEQHIVDLIEKIDCEVVLVCDLYLGSINHSLLSINELKRRNISVKGIVFNGVSNPESENHILKYSGYKKLLHVHREEKIDNTIIKKYASELNL